jgi:hypothetical protein
MKHMKHSKLFRQKRWPLFGFVGLFAVLGTVLLLSSRAATPYTSIESEKGTLSGTAVTLQSDANASSGQYVQFGTKPSTSPGGLYNGKLLGMNAFDKDAGVMQQLGVNSARAELVYHGPAFGDPDYNGTAASWIDTLTSAHIVPMPLLNQYVEMGNLDINGFSKGVVAWCQVYCAGGSFYKNNTSANQTYAPQTLEILNEPYGTWWGYPVTPNDINAYATLLKTIRSDLNTAGFKNIGITAAANNNWDSTKDFDTDLLNDGGYAAVQGVVVHGYGPIDLPKDTTGTYTNDWGQVYYLHKLLSDAGLASHANIYVTEVGYCTGSGGDCVGGTYTEAQKDANIATIINQLATVPFLKGFWYFNLRPYLGKDGNYNSFGFYDPNSDNKTPAWAAFQNAAHANGF